VRPEVFEAWVRGRHFLNRRNLPFIQKAIESFNEALRLDPSYAPAYVGLADAYHFLNVPNVSLPAREASRLATEAAMKALSIDPTSGEAHSTLGHVKHQLDWDWRGAEREFKQAITLSPNYALAHARYSALLLSIGRTDEALVEAKRALRLDPLGAAMHQILANWFAAVGRFDEAIEEDKKGIELDPTNGPNRYHMATRYDDIGRYEEALVEMKRAYEVSGNPAHRLGIAHELAHLGRTAEAEKIIEETKESLEKTSPGSIATVYAVLGRKEEAFQLLESAYEAHAYSMIAINRNPDLQSLRSDPRFQDLVRRVGWPQ
jgi:tetratricopeptide (TPR) repeat protein